MENKSNLIPLNKRSPEERKRIASMGGQRSNQKRREKKLFAESLKIALSGRIKDKDVQESLKAMGFKSEDFNNQAQLIMVMYTEALSGNMQAMKLLIESLNETPIEKVSEQTEDDSIQEMLTELKSRKVAGVDDE